MIDYKAIRALGEKLGVEDLDTFELAVEALMDDHGYDRYNDGYDDAKREESYY